MHITIINILTWMRSEYGDLLRCSGLGGGCGMMVRRRTRSPARSMFFGSGDVETKKSDV